MRSLQYLSVSIFPDWVCFQRLDAPGLAELVGPYELNDVPSTVTGHTLVVALGISLGQMYDDICEDYASIWCSRPGVGLWKIDDELRGEMLRGCHAFHQWPPLLDELIWTQLLRLASKHASVVEGEASIENLHAELIPLSSIDIEHLIRWSGWRNGRWKGAPVPSSIPHHVCYLGRLGIRRGHILTYPSYSDQTIVRLNDLTVSTVKMWPCLQMRSTAAVPRE